MRQLCAPREEESAAIAALMSRHAPEPVTEERVRLEWSSPGVDLARDDRVAVEDGAIVGFVAVERLDEGRVWLELHGEPVDELLDWALPHADGRILSGGWHGNRAVAAALTRRGFTLVRHSYRMAIELDGTQPRPEWPAGVQIRPFVPGDERLVYETHMETFEDSWEHVRQSYEEWAHWWVERPGFDPTLWFIAMTKDEVAGIALCRVSPEAPDTGWIGVLGVRRRWRRKGLGRALLLHAFRDFGVRGCSRAVLGVDAESLTGANVLYESVGMRRISTYDLYERR